MTTTRFSLVVFVTLLISATGLVVEIGGSRLIAPFVGTSLDVWTALIAVVLAGFAGGNALGGKLCDISIEKGIHWSAVALLVAGLTTILAFPLVAAVFSAIDARSTFQIVVASFLVFFIPSFAVGVPTPVLTNLVIRQSPEAVQGGRIGILYAAGSLGAIGGTLAAGYLLVPILGVSTTLAAAAFVDFASVLFLLFLARTRSANITAFALAGCALSFVPLGSLCQEETSYYCVRLVPAEIEGRDVSLFMLDDGYHSARSADGEPVFGYVDTMVSIIDDRFEANAPVEAFFLGGGGFDMPARLATDRPEARIVVAEIDPDLAPIAERLLGTDLSRVDVDPVDARVSLARQDSGSLDLIVADAFSGHSVPFHLVTSEFFDLAIDRLKPNGLLLMNVIDKTESPRFLVSLTETMRESFRSVSVLTTKGHGGDRTNYVVVATPESGDTTSADQIACHDCLPTILRDDRAPVEALLR